MSIVQIVIQFVAHREKYQLGVGFLQCFKKLPKIMQMRCVSSAKEYPKIIILRHHVNDFLQINNNFRLIAIFAVEIM